ncbi:MAG: periplasmic heavy metal sensor [Deltaproteobacteria bacterium]|nr:periplasmic heavy metal sensor [Deltaproteobacteria bacterium]
MLVTVVATLTLVYRYVKRAPQNQPIKGYLDLIPDLTPEQRHKVQEIRETFLPKVSLIRQNLCLERANLAQLLFAEPPDRSSIDAVARQILFHQSKLENEVIEHILEEREILSPSQQRRFYEIIVEQFSSGGLGVHDVRNKKN